MSRRDRSDRKEEKLAFLSFLKLQSVFICAICGENYSLEAHRHNLYSLLSGACLWHIAMNLFLFYVAYLIRKTALPEQKRQAVKQIG